MRPVFHDTYEKNQYNCPLSGQPDYTGSGIIFAEDEKGSRYAVSRIDFQRFDDQNFQYIFSPVWSIIDALPSGLFQGIPGLDMDLRLEKYYRVNMTPWFIEERTPGESREDLRELLSEVGLDYYDRFEWLLRTDRHAGTDNLIVERAHSPRHIAVSDRADLPADLQPGDCVEISGYRMTEGSGAQLRQLLLRILRSGAQVWDRSEEKVVSPDECSTLLRVLLAQQYLDDVQKKAKHAEGVSRAQKAGKYTGRKKIPVDPTLLQQTAEDFHRRIITEEEAMKRVGITSRSTFYRRLKTLNLPDK